ncbi:hypothetical protein [Raoultibacter massiliensis]|nr:hypothetical protein [Raoultibacter massiliensis]
MRFSAAGKSKRVLGACLMAVAGFIPKKGSVRAGEGLRVEKSREGVSGK